MEPSRSTLIAAAVAVVALVALGVGVLVGRGDPAPRVELPQSVFSQTPIKTLDTEGLEGQIASQLNTQLDTTGITVDCPDEVPATTGGEFNCIGIVPASGTVEIRVRQTDDDGHITWEVVDATTGPP